MPAYPRSPSAGPGPSTAAKSGDRPPIPWAIVRWSRAGNGAGPPSGPQGPDDGPGGPPATGQGPLDGRAVPVVAGDEQPLAERRRPCAAGPVAAAPRAARSATRRCPGAPSRRSDRPYSRANSPRMIASDGASGPTTEVATRCRPAGAYDGAAWLITTVFATISRRSPSTSRIGSSSGGRRRRVVVGGQHVHPEPTKRRQQGGRRRRVDGDQRRPGSGSPRRRCGPGPAPPPATGVSRSIRSVGSGPAIAAGQRGHATGRQADPAPGEGPQDHR